VYTCTYRGRLSFALLFADGLDEVREGAAVGQFHYYAKVLALLAHEAGKVPLFFILILILVLILI
jgi:hypothetical protein